MVLFSMRKISEDDRALINVLRKEKNWSSQRLSKVFWEELGLDNRGPAAEEN